MRRHEKECVYFSATADLWSSCTSEPYLCLTIHYISSDWALKSHCLQAHFTPEDHTGLHLQDAMNTTLREWNLDEQKLVAITTDSGSNIKLACTLLKWNRLSCFGHNLDLAVNKGLDDPRVDRVLSLSKKIVAAFSYSWKRKRDLRVAQEQHGLPQKKLKAAVSTRWGSQIDMVVRIIEQRDAIRVVLGQDRKASHIVPTWQDFDVLESVKAAVEPLRSLTDLLSGEKRVTWSAIKPLLRCINDKLLVHKDDDSALTCEIKDRVRRDLESRYTAEDTDLFLDKCSFLDPRFKDTFSTTDEAVEAVLTEATENASSVRSSNAGHIQSQLRDSEADCSQEQPIKKKGKFSATFGASVSTSSSSVLTVPDRFQQEVDIYMQYPTMDIDEHPTRLVEA